MPKFVFFFFFERLETRPYLCFQPFVLSPRARECSVSLVMTGNEATKKKQRALNEGNNEGAALLFLFCRMQTARVKRVDSLARFVVVVVVVVVLFFFIFSSICFSSTPFRGGQRLALSHAPACPSSLCVQIFALLLFVSREREEMEDSSGSGGEDFFLLMPLRLLRFLDDLLDPRP